MKLFKIENVSFTAFNHNSQKFTYTLKFLSFNFVIHVYMWGGDIADSSAQFSSVCVSVDDKLVLPHHFTNS